MSVNQTPAGQKPPDNPSFGLLDYSTRVAGGGSSQKKDFGDWLKDHPVQRITDRTVRDYYLYLGRRDPGPKNWYESFDAYERRVGFDANAGITEGNDPLGAFSHPDWSQQDQQVAADTFSLAYWTGSGVLGAGSLSGATKVAGLGGTDLGPSTTRANIKDVLKLVGGDIADPLLGSGSLKYGLTDPSVYGQSEDREGYLSWIHGGKALGYTRHFYAFVKYGKSKSGFLPQGYFTWVKEGKVLGYTRHFYAFIKYGKKR